MDRICAKDSHGFGMNFDLGSGLLWQTLYLPLPLPDRLACSKPKGYGTEATQSKRMPSARYMHTVEVRTVQPGLRMLPTAFFSSSLLPLTKVEGKSLQESTIIVHDF